MAKVSHLCAACVYALGHPVDDRPEEHHSTINAVRQAVQDGCFVCSHRWNTDEQGLVMRRDGKKAVVHEHDLPTKYQIEIFQHRGEQLISLCIWDVPEPSALNLLSKKVAESFFASPWQALDDRTSSSRSLDQAYGWLTSCRAQHPSCNRLSGSVDWLPTRLIDVGSEGNDLWKLRVVAEDGLCSSSTLYITLSYRWGTEPSIMLLESNMDQFRRGKPISDLPQTFKDLITVARHFSVPYIWIDALCIIQDSSQDWASESAAMRYVYANSTCTVAASASSGPEGGLFRSRQPELLRPGLVNIAYGDRTPEDYYIWDPGYWGMHFNKNELLGRGWIFQERFLSPRVLYFGHDQIMWECMKEYKCEGFPNGVPNQTSDKSSFAVSELASPRPSEPGDKQSLFSDEAFNLWGGLVDRYSRCSLTKATDRLAAFAGIAKFFQEHTGDEYVAGLWKSCLVEMLDWHVAMPRPGPVDYLAPSWSWASVQDGVLTARKSRLQGQVNLVSIAAVETTNLGADPTVGVRYGRIAVRGTLLPTRDAFRYFRTMSIATRISLDTSSEKWDREHPFLLLPIKSRYSRSPADDCTISYLILKKLCTGAPDIYRRVGFCRTDHHGQSYDQVFQDEAVDKDLFGVKPQFSVISIV